VKARVAGKPVLPRDRRLKRGARGTRLLTFVSLTRLLGRAVLGGVRIIFVMVLELENVKRSEVNFAFYLLGLGNTTYLPWGKYVNLQEGSLDLVLFLFVHKRAGGGNHP